MHTSHRVALLLVAGAAVIVAAMSAAGCAARDKKLANEGFYALESANYPEAEAKLKEAIQANPNNAYALLNLGALYQRTGRPAMARPLYEKVIALDAKDKPSKRSKGIPEDLNLKQMAQRNLAELPPK